MRRLLLLMFVAVVALPACTQEPFEDTRDSVKSGSVVTLQLNISESSIVQTKTQSTAEVTLNNLWFFVFNSSGTLERKSKVSVIKNDTRTADILVKSGVGLGFYVCANVSAAEEAKFNGLVEGVARVADLKAINSDRSLLIAPGLPMCGELLNQTITATTTRISITLTRSCSRVDVLLNGATNFTLTGIEKLIKTAPVGPIFTVGSLIPAKNTIDVVPTNTALASIYLYENAIVAADEAAAEGKATAIIVKGTYMGIVGYYKLRVKYGTPAQYDIGRNMIYSINITSVKAPGFATLADAEANFPQNMDYSITISNGNVTDVITSNGQYYLGVSNSEYAVYNSDALVDVPVVTVTHNVLSPIKTGTITASGAGLTLRTPTIPTTTQKQEIRVDMAASFTTGTLTLRLGNLMKVVTINKRPTINMNYGLITDYAGTSYVQGDWDEAPTWSKFTCNVIEVGNYAQRVQNPSGGIWMRFDQNFGSTNTPRSCAAYVTSADSKGRARIVVRQESGVLYYLSGAPTATLPSTNPAAFIVRVKTDMAGWTIKAFEMNRKPVAITMSAKTGAPIKGTPIDCSMSVTVSNNPGAQRPVFLYLSAIEDATVEILFASLTQAQL